MKGSDRFTQSISSFMNPNASTLSIKEYASCSSFYNSNQHLQNAQQLYLHPQNSTNKRNSKNENVKVAVRVRPPLPRELKEDCSFLSTVDVSPDFSQIVICDFLQAERMPTEKIESFISNPNNYPKYAFTFDHVYDQDSSQQEVYENTARQSVLSVLEGFNSTIFAYGQTGTGKTYTMEGFTMRPDDPQIGIIPRAMTEIFEFIANCESEEANFMVRCSYLQIYNEIITDLLKSDKQSLQIREDKKKGIYVEDLSEWAVRSPIEVFHLLSKGKQSRATAITKLNDTSSRSHAVFIVVVEQVYMNLNNDNGPSKVKTGKLNLVDLAGSERVSVSGATGQRLEECKKINQSLAALGNVISALTEVSGPRSHIPYRDSKITRLLEGSLGGNCKTTMIAMISPSPDAFNHSLSTLKFSTRAKNIQNCPEVNQADEDAKALLVQYEHELKRLKSQLENKRKSIFDINNILKVVNQSLQGQVTQAEIDKEEALAAYQEKLEELQQEKEVKKDLEEQIKAIQSQVLVGGQRADEERQYIRTLEEKQSMIRSEYEEKIEKLEKERREQEEGKIEAAEYRQLLLKQRDVMVGLSQRLVERDNRIVELEGDLELLEDIEFEAQNKVKILEQSLKNNNLELPSYSRIGDSDDQVMIDARVTFNVTEKNLECLLQDERQFIQHKSYRQVQDLKKKIEEFLNKKKRINDEELKELKDIQALREQYEEKFKHLDNKFKKKIDFLETENSKYHQNIEKISEQLASKDAKLRSFQEEQFKKNKRRREVFMDLKSAVQAIREKAELVVQILSNNKDPQSIKQVARELVQLQISATKAEDLVVGQADTVLSVTRTRGMSSSAVLNQNETVIRQDSKENSGVKVEGEFEKKPSLNKGSSQSNGKIKTQPNLQLKLNIDHIISNAEYEGTKKISVQTSQSNKSSLLQRQFSRNGSDLGSPSHQISKKMKEEEDEKRKNALMQIDTILKGHQQPSTQRQYKLADMKSPNAAAGGAIKQIQNH